MERAGQQTRIIGKVPIAPGGFGAEPVANRHFITTFAGTLDAKGRVCVPASWRQVLTEQNTSGVYVCTSIDGDSLIGFGEELMAAELARLDAGDAVFSQVPEDLAHLVSNSSQLPIDENGRVRLPEELINAAGLKDRVVFVGMGKKFEIWNPDSFAPVKARRLANARAERAARTAQELAARTAMHSAATMPAAPTTEGAP
jgi:MraZ protein